MIIAAAQTKPHKHQTDEKIRDHVRLIELAAQHGVQLIVFPEMSLTGYERESAEELAFAENDLRLHILKDLAVRHQMIIVTGAPIRMNEQLYIGSFIFLPDATHTIYTKQFLHEGEEIFFSPSLDYNPLIKLEDQTISVAICADITHPDHPARAAEAGATLYIAGIFYTPGGIAEAYEQLSDYSKTHTLNILMANYGGPSYHFESAGQSAFWNNQGELIGKMDTEAEGLLVVEGNGSHWSWSIIHS